MRLGVYLRLLFVSAMLLGVGGCAYTLTGGARISPNEANENLYLPMVGKNTTLHGVVHFTGHIAPFIKTPNGPIYLLGQGSMPWKPESQELQGKSVSVTGVLRLHDWTTHGPHRYFYFDAEAAQIKQE
jgi:hypothetical protein